MKYFWSRAPGRSVHVSTGKVIEDSPSEHTVGEWYETLGTVIDTALRNTANKRIVTNADPLVILQHSPNLFSHHGENEKQDIVGSFRGKTPIYFDANLEKNKIIVGNDTITIFDMSII